MNFKQLCTDVSKAADKECAKLMAAVMNEEFIFKGLDASARSRIMQNQLASDKDPDILDWEFIECCWDQNIREFQYFALSYLTEKRELLKKADLSKLKQLVLAKPSWDTNNILHKLINLHTAVYPELSETVASWSESDNIWLKRVAVLYQLERGEYINLNYARKAIENSLDYPDHYLREAIKESLKDIKITHPKFVDDLIFEHEDKLGKEIVEALKSDE